MILYILLDVNNPFIHTYITYTHIYIYIYKRDLNGNGIFFFGVNMIKVGILDQKDHIGSVH